MMDLPDSTGTRTRPEMSKSHKTDVPKANIEDSSEPSERVVTTPNRTVRSPGSVYPEDIWEKTPKTDYTYSHSGSYKPRSLHEGYISPNMSRRRLRGGAVNLTPTVKKPPSGAPFSGRSHHDDNMPVDNDRTRYDGSFLHPPSGNFNKRGNPRSATRSGTPYGAIWERDEKGRPRKRASTGIKPSPLKKNLDITNPAAYRQFEKELEYAGEASPYKESSLSHLYEEEMPPKSQPKRKPQKSVAVDEQKTTWWTTIVTIITTIITSTTTVVSTGSQAVMRTLGLQTQNGPHTLSESESVFTRLWRWLKGTYFLIVTWISAPVRWIGTTIVYHWRALWSDKSTSTVIVSSSHSSSDGIADITDDIADITDTDTSDISQTDLVLSESLIVTLSSAIWESLKTFFSYIFVPVVWLWQVIRKLWASSEDAETVSAGSHSLHTTSTIMTTTTTTTVTTETEEALQAQQSKPTTSSQAKLGSSLWQSIKHFFTIVFAPLLWVWATITEWWMSSSDVDTVSASTTSSSVTTTTSSHTGMHTHTPQSKSTLAQIASEGWHIIKKIVWFIFAPVIWSWTVITKMWTRSEHVEVSPLKTTAATNTTHTTSEDNSTSYTAHSTSQATSVSHSAHSRLVSLGSTVLDYTKILITFAMGPVVWLYMCTRTTLSSVTSTIYSAFSRTTTSSSHSMTESNNTSSSAAVNPTTSTAYTGGIMWSLWNGLCDTGDSVRVWVASRLLLLYPPMHYMGNMMWQSWVAAGSRIHRFLATTIVTDVWILHSTYTSGRRHGMCCCVPLLFILLIPLLLTGTYYMYDRGYASLPVSTVSKDSIHGQSIMGVNDRELASRVQKILVGLLRDREVDQNNQLHLYKQEVTVNQQQVFDTYKNDMEATFESLLAKVEARVDKLESNTAKSREEWLEHQQAVLASQKTDMEGLIAAMVERLVGAALAEQNAKIIALQKEGNAAAAAEQQEKLAAYRASMDTLLRDLIHQELGAFAAQAQGQDKEELAKQVTLQAEQGARIQEVSDQLSMVLAKADDLSNEIVAAKAGMQNQGEQDRNHTVIIVSKLEEQLAALRGNIEQLRASHAALLLQMKDCCKNDSAFAMLVKAGLQEEFAGMIGGGGSGNLAGMSMGGSGDGEKGSPFTNWLRDQFVKKDDIDAKMAVVAARLNDQIKSHAAEAVAAAAAAGGLAGGAGCNKCTGGTGAGIVLNTDGSGVSEEQVRMLIRDALIVFGADKTGMVDYAMESAGGSVLSTRCSETYHRRTAQLSLFGIPLWYASNSPRTVIQPDVNPGQCWAFRGSEGYIVVQLAGVVKPTAFTVEHIPKSLSPTGKIDSAPKMFSIWGLDHDRDREGIFIGNYTYQEEGEPLQYFPVSDPNIKAFPIVEMRIHSNWGNPEYTCLYRFRVHGVLKKW